VKGNNMENKKSNYLINLLTSICIFLILISCNVDAKTFSYTLTWDANSEPDLSHYIIYWGTSSKVYNYNSGNIGLNTIYTGTINIPDDTKVTYFYAVTAVDTSGLESDFSNEVFQDYDNRTPPAKPKNLKWYEKIISWFQKRIFFWS
jgi:fibronectin type 3 domain-containing protein